MIIKTKGTDMTDKRWLRTLSGAIADGCSRGEGDCAAGEEVGTENGARHKIVMGEVVFSLVVVD